MSNVIATFGIWQVTEDGMECPQYGNYHISIPSLFATTVEQGKQVWDFPLHLTEKTWLIGPNAHNMADFNQAFAFAQQHFASERPASTQNVSDSFTQTLQKAMMR